MGAQTAQTKRRHLARNDDYVQNVGKVSQQAIEDRVDRRVVAQMMVIVKDENELLLDTFQDLVEKDINGAFRMLRDFAGCLLKVGEERGAGNRAPAAGYRTPDNQEDRRSASGVI